MSSLLFLTLTRSSLVEWPSLLPSLPSSLVQWSVPVPPPLFGGVFLFASQNLAFSQPEKAQSTMPSL